MKNLQMFFPGIGYFKGTFSLQGKDGVKLYQTPPRHIAYMFQEPIKKELERLQQEEK